MKDASYGSTLPVQREFRTNCPLPEEIMTNLKEYLPSEPDTLH
jgi:hypothetical protein